MTATPLLTHTMATERLQLAAAGPWTSADAGRLEQLVEAAARAGADARQVAIEVGVDELDTAGAWLRSQEGREVLIEVVLAPDLVIPAAVVTGAPYLMQARVPELSRFLLIHAAAFRQAVATEPALAQAVIGSLARQFRRMVCQIKNLKLRSSTQRVGCYIQALSARQGMPDRTLLPYEKNLIASELGMTRESFSRALSSLEKSGIRIEGQTVMIVDGPRLAHECALDPLIDRASPQGSIWA
jgi:CRP/FNR family transcriptional regulator, transcriptional activator FtrB